MALLVQKFGGTSLATIMHIQHAADLVARARKAGHDVVVIVSAMSGETDRLIKLAQQVSEHVDSREYAALVATGEQVSMALMAMALQSRGVQARSYTGTQARIQTCGDFQNARIRAVDTTPILHDLQQGRVVVIAGFQGVDENGNITTLGRGGSDTTAVAIAAALQADECQIYTDVDGVYTTDPRVEPTAQRLEQVTFEEMLELSGLGAKVLQIRAVEFAGKYNVPLRVLSSTEESQGTLVTYNAAKPLDAPVVTGIAFSRNEAKISLCGVPESPGIASLLLAEITALGVTVDMILQHVTVDHKIDFIFAVNRDYYAIIIKQIQTIAKRVCAREVIGITSLAKVSLVGVGLKSHQDVAPKMLQTLVELGIQIHLVAAAEIKISVIIDEDKLDDGVRALHRAFQLSAGLINKDHYELPLESVG